MHVAHVGSYANMDVLVLLKALCDPGMVLGLNMFEGLTPLPSLFPPLFSLPSFFPFPLPLSLPMPLVRASELLLVVVVKVMASVVMMVVMT